MRAMSLSFDFLGQAVAAQQQLHCPGATCRSGFRRCRLLRIGHAERLGHHVAMRMGTRLLDG
jgi:hypothetical protein